MQFANKHFDFNARYIQLPPLSIRTSPLRLDNNDGWHLWVAAQTLLSLQHHGNLTQDPAGAMNITSDSDIVTSDSSSSSSDVYVEEEEESSNESSNKRQSTDEEEQIQVQTITGGVIKPRWSDQERARLIQAVIQEKKLDVAKSFHWHRISLTVPHHSSRACQDRWFNEMLRLINEMYQSD